MEQGRGISAAEAFNRPSLKLEGQRLSGSTGCNSFTATISETGERVKIENLSLTRKLCAAQQNENERAFVNALAQTWYLTKEPNRITFLSDKREPLLVWTSGGPEKEGSHDRSLILPRVTKSEKSEAHGEQPSKQHRAKTAHRARNGEIEERPAKEALHYAIQPVFFGTDRNRENDRPKDDRQLAAFGSDGSGRLTLGQAIVTVPLTGRDKGDIPRPKAGGLFSKPEEEDAAKHFTLFDVVVMTEKEFVGAVRRRLDESKESKTFDGQAFVFVHGYNVTFDEALYRTAQIAYDLDFDGAPFLYSWPSKGSGVLGLLGYKRDLDHALAARARLLDFMNLVTRQPNIKELHLIAHSMGSWPLLEVLDQIAKDAAAQRGLRINQIILAAPDMDRANFAAVAERIKPLAKNFTMYASSRDWAMLASGVLALGDDRVGYVPSNGVPAIVPGVETIDVSQASLDFFSLSHTDFAERRHILYDIGLILRAGMHPPDKRLPVVYEKVEKPAGVFWKYKR